MSNRTITALDLGQAVEFPVGAFKVVRIDHDEIREVDRQIGVLRLADGGVYAVRNLCPHRRAPICSGTVGGTLLPSAPQSLRYGMANRVLRCPWHGYEFDVATGQGLFTTELRLKTYPARIEGDRIVVALELQHSELPAAARRGTGQGRYDAAPSRAQTEDRGVREG